MFDIITYLLLGIFICSSLYLAGITLKTDSKFSNNKLITKKDMLHLEEKLTNQLNVITKSVESIELSTKILLDKKSEDRIKKVEEIVSTIELQLKDHCTENKISFEDLIAESTRIETDMNSQINKLQFIQLIMKLEDKKKISKRSNEPARYDEMIVNAVVENQRVS